MAQPEWNVWILLGVLRHTGPTVVSLSPQRDQPYSVCSANFGGLLMGRCVIVIFFIHSTACTFVFLHYIDTDLEIFLFIYIFYISCCN